MVSDEEEERCGAWGRLVGALLPRSRRCRSRLGPRKDYVSVTTRHDGSTADYTLYVTVHIIRDTFTLRRRLVWNDGRPFACTLRADLGTLVHSLAFPRWNILIAYNCQGPTFAGRACGRLPAFAFPFAVKCGALFIVSLRSLRIPFGHCYFREKRSLA